MNCFCAADHCIDQLLPGGWHEKSIQDELRARVADATFQLKQWLPFPGEHFDP